jgi:hypothetical protein
MIWARYRLNKLWEISIEQDDNEYLHGIVVYNTGTPGVPAVIYLSGGRLISYYYFSILKEMSNFASTKAIQQS